MRSRGEARSESLLWRGQGTRGFSLVEALVSAALLGWILLIGLQFLVLERQTEERLAAHRQAMRSLETAVEAIRIGWVDLEEGPFSLEGLAASSFGVRLNLEIEEEQAMSDLLHVRVVATYTVRRETFRRDLETLVWRP